jgi:hypothetical protein
MFPVVHIFKQAVFRFYKLSEFFLIVLLIVITVPLDNGQYRIYIMRQVFRYSETC